MIVHTPTTTHTHHDEGRPVAMRIKMLRNLPLKPGKPEPDQRYEGQEYDVSNKEGAKLIASGLALDLNAPPPEPEADAEEEEEEEAGDGLDGMKFGDLKKLAATEGITLTGKSKAAAVAEIRAARSGTTGEADDEADETDA